jgi:hypothetical protein
VIERFTGEAPLRFLTGEGWGKKRTDQIVSLIEKRLEELDTWQGKHYITGVLSDHKTNRLQDKQTL